MRKPRADDIRIATEAARWQQLLCGGSASERDRAEFVDWAKASPRHLREFLYAEALEAAVSEANKDLPIDTGLDLSGAEEDVIPLEKARTPGRRHRRYSRALLAAAAVAATAFGVAWWAGGEPLGGWRNFETRVGEQRGVQLADGSVMQLNTDTRIRVRYGENGRDIELVHGEAFFKVSRDPQRPFRVRAGQSVIRALGTQFDVYHRARSIKVAVIEGKVEVSDAGARSDGAAAKLIRAELARGEAVRIAPTGHVVAQRDLDIAAVTAWQQRRLVFTEEALGHIAEEFNRYNIEPRIVIESEEVRARRLGGTFDADDPESLVSFVLRSGDLVAEREGDRLILRPRSGGK